MPAPARRRAPRCARCRASSPRWSRAYVEALIGLRAWVEPAIDFPEEEIDFLSDGELAQRLEVVRGHFGSFAAEDHVDVVPVFPRRTTQSVKRTRVLEDAELRSVMKALDGGVGSLTEGFRLMLYTGQRRGEVLSMRWADVTEEKDGAWWTIPAERHKGGRDHRVPLTSPAVEALKRL